MELSPTPSPPSLAVLEHAVLFPTRSGDITGPALLHRWTEEAGWEVVAPFTRQESQGSVAPLGSCLEGVFLALPPPLSWVSPPLDYRCSPSVCRHWASSPLTHNRREGVFKKFVENVH